MNINPGFIPAALILCLMLGQTAVSQQNDGLLSPIINQCQSKMVKVYGASAGNVEGYSTGIIVSDDGKILTIQGVFLDGRQVRVVTIDGVSHQATVLKRDRETQLALLKINTETPEHFKLGSEPIGEKGDWVVSISNAFKVADKTEPLSATLGIVSLRTKMDARLNKRDVAYRGDLVLIDSITSNPGAGGGAVVTLEGQLVGMIGKIISSSETNTRINYCVPNSVLTAFVSGVANTTKPAIAATGKKVDLGIKLFKLGGRNAPAYIDQVVRGGPAAETKLKSDDMIITIAGEKIANSKDYNEVLTKLTPGSEVIIVVKRGLDILRLPIVPREKK